MEKYKDLLVNLFVFGMSTFATKLVSFILVPLYTSYFNASEFGITDMALTVISLIFPLASLSLGDATLRYAINDPDNKSEYISLGFWGTIFSCFIVLLCLPILDFSFFGGLGNYKLLFFLSYCFNALLIFFGNVARVLNQLALITWDSVFSSLSTAGTAFVLIAFMGTGVSGYFLSLIIGSCIGILFFVILGKHYHYINFPFVKFVYIKPMLVYALPLIPNSLFWWIGTSVNRFFITGLLGIASSGLFAAASKLPNLLNVVYSVFQQAWNLSAFQEFKNNDINKFFTNVYIILECLLAISASLLIVLSPFIAFVFLKNGFYDGWIYMPFLVLAIYFNCLNSFYGTIFTAALNTRPLFTTTMIGAISSIVLTGIFIPVFGLLGPCIAMAISNFLVLISRFLYSKHIIRISNNLLISIFTVLILISQSVVLYLHIYNYWLIVYSLLISLIVLHLFNFISIIRNSSIKYFFKPPKHASR